MERDFKTNRNNRWEKGQSAYFVLDAEDIGSEIEAIQLRHVPKSSFASVWYLGYIAVRVAPDHEMQVCFIFLFILNSLL